MEKNTGPAWAEDDGHLACGCFDGAELEDSGSCGFAGVMLRRLVCSTGAAAAFEEVHGDATAAAAGAAGGVDAIFRDDEDVEASKRLSIRCEGSVGGSDEDA